MPYWCLGKIARALNAHEKAVKGSKIQLLGVSYKADIDDTRESPALKMIELLQEAGADVSYHDPRAGACSRPDRRTTRACGGRLRRDRHRALGHRLRRPRPAGATRRRPARTRPARTGRERQGLEAGSGSGTRARLLGPNLARNFGSLAELRWLCDLSPDLLESAARADPQARTTADFEELLADEEVDAVVIATPVVTHYESPSRRSRPGSTSSSRSPGPVERRGGGAGRARAGAGARPHAGYLPLTTALQRLKEVIDGGELGDVL